MERCVAYLLIFLTTLSSFGATPKYHRKKEINLISRELRFLELKAKKEINDKKNPNLKKYLTAVLTAREFRLIGADQKALEFYKIANDIKVDIDKKEVHDALKKKNDEENLYFFKSDLHSLITNRKYEKAILAINPFALKYKQNENMRIIYDLLNVKFKKLNVQKLYCIDHAQSEVEDLTYDGLLCDFLNDYLKEGKKDRKYVSYVEHYFLKNDLKKRYLLNIIYDI